MADLDLRALGPRAPLGLLLRLGEVSREDVALLARLGDEQARDVIPEPPSPISPEAGRLAASLGHPLATRVYPDAKPVDWRVRSQRRGAIETAGRHGVCVVSLACDYAERVLPLWEREYPDDARPRRAIEAARAWVANPCEETRRAAVNAADDVAAAANDADDDADAAYAAAADAATARGAAAAAAANAAAAAYAAADAAYAAYAADADYADDAAYAAAAAYAAYAAADAADAAADAEREWQRLHLADELLRE